LAPHADSEQLLAALLELAVVAFKLTKEDVDKAVKPDVPI
jgi:hypothetical protein